jgi:hypothetical protein
MEMGLGPDQTTSKHTTSSPGVGIGTPARATTRCRRSKAPQDARKEIGYHSKPSKRSQANVARGLHTSERSHDAPQDTTREAFTTRLPRVAD